MPGDVSWNAEPELVDGVLELVLPYPQAVWGFDLVVAVSAEDFVGADVDADSAERAGDSSGRWHGWRGRGWVGRAEPEARPVFVAEQEIPSERREPGQQVLAQRSSVAWAVAGAPPSFDSGVSLSNVDDQ
jgi:hypothetical protein